MKSIFPLLGIFFVLQLKAQLHDYTWMVSHEAANGTNSQVDFKTNPPTISNNKKLYAVATTAAFSNEGGNLLFYTNGLKIHNHLDSLIENGDSINAGYWADVYWFAGYPVMKGGFFLPAPGDSTQIFFLHLYHEHFPTASACTKLLYTSVDVNENNGLGKVVEKNTPLIEGDLELNFSHAVAVRHANGRDWWILLPHRMQPQFFRFLLTPTGFSNPEMQEIGFKVPTTNPYEYFSTGLFSPDGSKYVEYEFGTGIQIFDFDRCTGLLSNPGIIDYDWNPTVDGSNGVAGIAISPSSRFLYMTRARNLGYQIAQYDLQSLDIPSSEILIFSCIAIGNYDCGAAHVNLFPDGKIYVGADVDTTSFHIIHQPDSLGLACDFEYGGFKFPLKYPRANLPYVPNYRLYDVPGSPCDTLGINGELLTSFTSDKKSGCTPLTVNYQNTTYYELDSVQWHFPGGDPSFSNAMNPGILYESPGTFDATLIVFADSLTDTLSLPGYIHTIADDCPQAEIFTQINDLSVTAWTNCEDGLSYSWDMGNGLVFNTEGVTIQYDSAGTYALQLIVNGACGSDTAWATVAVEDPTSTKNPETQFNFKVQPASEMLHISFNQPNHQPITLTLHDLAGRMVQQWQVPASVTETTFSLADMPNGMFFWSLTLQGRTMANGKLIILK